MQINNYFEENFLSAPYWYKSRLTLWAYFKKFPTLFVERWFLTDSIGGLKYIHIFPSLVSDDKTEAFQQFSFPHFSLQFFFYHHQWRGGEDLNSSFCGSAFYCCHIGISVENVFFWMNARERVGFQTIWYLLSRSLFKFEANSMTMCCSSLANQPFKYTSERMSEEECSQKIIVWHRVKKMHCCVYVRIWMTILWLNAEGCLSDVIWREIFFFRQGNIWIGGTDILEWYFLVNEKNSSPFYFV